MANTTGKKFGGRKKGVPNKDKSLLKAMCLYLIDGGYEKFKKELDKLQGQAYVKYFIQLSKLAAKDDLSSVQANEMIIELLNNKIKNNGTSK